MTPVSQSRGGVRAADDFESDQDARLCCSAERQPRCLASTPSSPPRRHDILLTVNLVTSYVCLVRICRAVFTQLYHVFLFTPPAETSAALMLPSVQFGKFQIDDNPAIQVRVLVELSLSMLLRIEHTLGISGLNGSSGCGAGAGPSGRGGSGGGKQSAGEYQHPQHPALCDPVAVSLREIILSQERMQSAESEGGDVPLKDLMAALKRLLER